MSTGAAVNVSKLGYVGLETPDVERMVEYYTRVLDFVVVEQSHHAAFLTTGIDHHCLVVTQSDTPAARTAVGYEIHEPLDDAQHRLEAAGLTIRRRSDIGPGTPDVLVLDEPGTGVPLHLMSAQTAADVDGRSWLRPTKLGHVAAYSPSLGSMQSFYQDLLGFRWSDTLGDFFVFLRCNADHHAANFMASSTAQGMHHIAYEMRDPEHLLTMLDHLAGHGYRLSWGPGRHGPGHNMFTYHRDPDGNTVELFTQIDVVHDEAQGYWEPRPWHETFPMYPQTWEADAVAANAWGPLAASDF